MFSRLKSCTENRSPEIWAGQQLKLLGKSSFTKLEEITMKEQEAAETDDNESILPNTVILRHWKMFTGQSTTMLYRLILTCWACAVNIWSCWMKWGSQKQSSYRLESVWKTINNTVVLVDRAKMQLFSLTVEEMILVPCLVCSSCLSREWWTYRKEIDIDQIILDTYPNTQKKEPWNMHTHTHLNSDLSLTTFLHFYTIPHPQLTHPPTNPLTIHT